MIKDSDVSLRAGQFQLILLKWSRVRELLKSNGREGNTYLSLIGSLMSDLSKSLSVIFICDRNSLLHKKFIYIYVHLLQSIITATPSFTVTLTAPKLSEGIFRMFLDLPAVCVLTRGS